MMWDVSQAFSPPPPGYGSGPPPPLQPPSGHKGHSHPPSHYPPPSHGTMPFQPLGMPAAVPALARPHSYHYTNEFGPAPAQHVPGPASAPFPGGFAAPSPAPSTHPATSQTSLLPSKPRSPTGSYPSNYHPNYSHSSTHVHSSAHVHASDHGHGASAEKLRRKPPKKKHSHSDSHIVTVGAPAAPIEIHVHHALRPGLPAQTQRPVSIPHAVPPPQSQAGATVNGGRRRRQDGRAAATAALAKPPDSGFKYSACTGRRKALCIGINYTKSAHELFGCINDAKAVRKFLMNHHRFRREDIVMLTDDASDTRSLPTRQNILDAMRWLVKDAHEDDSLFFHYSGHGAQTRDKDGDEIDGFDEVIFPLDYKKAGHIVDDEMHAVMVSALPTGCRLTALFDSCHSGSVLDLPYLYHSDGRLKGLQVSKKAMELRRSTADVISWSGCQDGQTSADTYENGVAVGAMSYAFMSILNENPNHTYQSLLREVRRILRDKYSQKPQLSSSHKIDTGLKFVI